MKEEIEEEHIIKRDKIFENTYDEKDVDFSDISFKVESSFESKSYENTIDEILIQRKILEVIEQEKRFDRFRIPDENGNFKKMNKVDINDIYSFVTGFLSTDPRIEIFSVISSIFDIKPEKFYESLSNTFKTELITELKSRGYLQKQNPLF